MGLQVCFRPKLMLEQRLVLKQCLQQRLQLKLTPPSGWDFTEPTALKEIHHEGGRCFVEIDENELRSYAHGCKTLAGIIEQEDPDLILVALRGANPVINCTKYLLKKSYPTRSVKTSYFLKNVTGKIESVIGPGSNCPNKILMIDTSVTGTKLSWFLPQMLNGLSDYVESEITVVTAIFKHSEPELRKINTESYDNVQHRSHMIGVQNLICEDNPSLLGVKYDPIYDGCKRAAEGKISAYGNVYPADIHVKTRAGTQVHKLVDGTTFTLFIGLLGSYLKNTME